MSLYEYLIVLKTLLSDEYTFIMIYVRLEICRWSSIPCTFDVRPTLPGSYWHDTTMRKS